jgi:hypothetical protein
MEKAPLFLNRIMDQGEKADRFDPGIQPSFSLTTVSVANKIFSYNVMLFPVGG